MDEIQRFGPVTETDLDGLNYPSMGFCVYGDYVSYNDHKAIVDELEKEIEFLNYLMSK